MNAQRPASSAVYREVASAIGRRAARKLIEKMGGMRIYVPKAMPDDHDIVKAIGRADAAQLSNYFHGTHLQLPVLSAPLRRQRVRDLGQAEDLTRTAIAGETGYSERQVYRILGGEVRDSRQRSLFGDDE